MFQVLPHGYAIRLRIVIVLSVLLALFDAALLLIVRPLLDAAIHDTAGILFGRSFGLIYLSAIAFAIVLAKNGLFIWLAWYRNRLMFRIQEFFSERIFENFILAGTSRDHGADSGRKLSYVIGEPLQAVLNVYLPMISLINEVALIVFISVSLFIVDFKHTAALLAVLIVIIGAFHLVTRHWLRISGARRKDADSARNDIVRSAIDAEADLKAMKWVGRLINLYHIPNHVSATMTANKAFTTDIVKNVIEVAVVVALGALVLGSTTDSIGSLVPLLAVYAVAAYRLMPSLNRLIVCSQSIRFGLPSLDVVGKMVERRVSKRSNMLESYGCSPFDLVIDIKELKSPSGAVLVKDTELRLERGSVVAVRGSSGIGKSTMLKAIVNGAEGMRIQLDNLPLEGGLADAGLRIGMVGQRPFVVPASLGYNILPDLSVEHPAGQLAFTPVQRRVARTLGDKHLGSIISEDVIEGHLEMTIGASSLSGGQAQRVALMRALMLGDDILLLDEPTSALDPVSRDRFIVLLEEMSATRAVVVVTHDPAILKIATRTLELRTPQ